MKTAAAVPLLVLMSAAAYRVTLRRFTSPRGVWTPVRIEYGAGEVGR